MTGDAVTRLRPLVDMDLPAAHALTAALRWPYRLEDWAFNLMLGEGLAAERGGRLIGTAMGWRYGPEAGTLGMVVVTDAAQGSGLGRALTAGVLDMLGKRSVTLHATAAGLPLYRKLGFAGLGLLRQHQGVAVAPASFVLPPGLQVPPLRAEDEPLLAALDRRALGMPRQALIRALLAIAEGVVLKREGEAIGFSLLRRFGHGELIGPVIAPDVEAAWALIAVWLGSHAGRFLRIDVPDEHGLSHRLVAHGLAEAGTGERMVRGVPPQGDGGVTSFALVSQALG